MSLSHNVNPWIIIPIKGVINRVHNTINMLQEIYCLTEICFFTFEIMRETLKTITIYSLSILYISVGFKIFYQHIFFPCYRSSLHPISWINGLYIRAIWNCFGVLLVPRKTRKYGALGLLVLLIAVFPANIYLFTS